MIKLRLVLFFFVFVNFFLVAQVDTNFIEYISRDRSLQFHLTAKDLSVQLEQGGKKVNAFQNNNLSAGLYLKRDRYELFFAVPLSAFNNVAIGSSKTFGTGFGLNFYPKKFHLNYNFKYIQGYESLSQVREDRLKTLTEYNYFFFNRLNIHYIANAEKYSLRSALRFGDRQKRSAGSWILSAPISYHFGKVDRIFELEDVGFSRFAIGAQAGYAYSYIYGNWNASIIFKAGGEVRRTEVSEDVNYGLFPTINVISSISYDVRDYFLGLGYNYYPEYDYGNDYNFRVENWKLRLYIGRRFL